MKCYHINSSAIETIKENFDTCYLVINTDEIICNKIDLY